MRSRHGGRAIVATDRPRPPSVARLLDEVRRRADHDATDAGALGAVARAEIDAERAKLRDGAPPRSLKALAEAVEAAIDAFLDPTASIPGRVVNATGVVLHTNLGRAPWPDVAQHAALAAASGYGYLELDPVAGRRGPRFRLAEDHLVALTGAEDALVVNNNAAALACAVGLAGRQCVVVSRGELVEIGGGVRIPEIIRRAGARLIEVGTTNRTRVEDFEPPLAEGRASVVLRVHPSNFTIEGFAEAPGAAQLAELAHRHGAIVVDDLGSGALLDTAAFGLAHEPMPDERLAAGSDVVLFSGDKLVGGPQAGLIVGSRTLVARLRKDPLARAMRPDKAILAGVAATLGLYRAGVAALEIPVWQAIAAPVEALRERAEWICAMAAAMNAPARPTVTELRSTVGGGSLPGQTLPSAGVAIRVASPSRVAARLRLGPDPVLARIEDGAVAFDLRTVRLAEDALLVRRLGELEAGG